jgi:hypothetical protein
MQTYERKKQKKRKERKKGNKEFVVLVTSNDLKSKRDMDVLCIQRFSTCPNSSTGRVFIVV